MGLPLLCVSTLNHRVKHTRADTDTLFQQRKAGRRLLQSAGYLWKSALRGTDGRAAGTGQHKHEKTHTLEATRKGTQRRFHRSFDKMRHRVEKQAVIQRRSCEVVVAAACQGFMHRFGKMESVSSRYWTSETSHEFAMSYLMRSSRRIQ